MKTLEHLVNKNIYYVGTNHSLFKSIALFMADQKSKAVFIGNNKSATGSINRELGNLRASSYAYTLEFTDAEKYPKNLERILKNRERPDYLILSFKPEFQDIHPVGNTMVDATFEEITAVTDLYIANTLKTIHLFLEHFVSYGQGTIAFINSEESTNPIERLYNNHIGTYLIELNKEIKKCGHSGIHCKSVAKKASTRDERFVSNFAKLLDSSKTSVIL